jgi:hypothetical protein
MIDAIDSFLNNAVDLYVQAVDYCRISTSQIQTPIGAGIRQIKPESGDVRHMSPDSGDVMPDSGQTGRIPAQIRPESRDTGRRGRIRLFWPNLRPTNRKLARTAGFRSTGRDLAVLCRIPATFAGICICQILCPICFGVKWFPS